MGTRPVQFQPRQFYRGTVNKTQKELINNFKKYPSRDTVPLTVTFLMHSFLNCINMVYFHCYDPVFTKKEEIKFSNSRINLKQVKDPLPPHGKGEPFSQPY